MANSIKFMVDDSGTKTSAVVPIKTWMKLNEDYQKLQKKFELFVGLKSAIQETSKARKTGEKLQTLKDLLNDNLC